MKLIMKDALCWQGFSPSLELLRGQALLDGTGDCAEVVCFPVDSLPKDPAARFAAVFAARAEWKLEDLVPYLEDLQVEDLGAVTAAAAAAAAADLE